MAAALPRILCMHGFAQSGSIFRAKTGALRKRLKKVADFVFMDAPLKVPDEYRREAAAAAGASEKTDDADAADEAQLSWFHFSMDRSTYTGMEGAVAAVATTIKEQGPFDGIMSFSQGACALAMIMAFVQAHQGGKELPVPGITEEQLTVIASALKKVIFVSGFLPHDATLTAFVKSVAPLSTPSLHVYGKGDEIIAPDRSEGLAQVFGDAVVFTHTGAHHVPASKDMADSITAFLQSK